MTASRDGDGDGDGAAYMAVRMMVACSGKDCVKLAVGCCTSTSKGTGTRWRGAVARGGQRHRRRETKTHDSARGLDEEEDGCVQQLNGYDDGFHSGEGSFCDGGRRS
ncbi:DUF1906 domain-containing protein [Sesbania bispinosa]|nr:DUF1906 domain-containing protein [Sesbania bispinosa]